MNEVLGILDSLEAAIVDGKKVPMTNKVILDERYILSLIDKVRLSVKNNSNVARETVDVEQAPAFTKESIGLSSAQVNQRVTEKMIQKAEGQAEEIKSGANIYADDVLANLQLLVAKLQKNLVSMDKNIDSGRTLLESKRIKGDTQNENG